jgi:D-alanine-D-alanine ligase
MKKKIRVAILFGGKSAEHEISLISARNIVEAMDKNKYAVVAIGIDKQGRWHLDEGARLLHGKSASKVEFQDAKNAAAVLPGDNATPMVRPSGAGVGAIDVVFPILHGPFGEDGTVQGLLKLANLPFVGAGVLGSAVGMDKVMMKAAFEQNNLPVVSYLWVLRSQLKKKQEEVLAWIEGNLHYPLFVKPANLGSSVGISRARNRDELQFALDVAGHYDRKLLVEEAVEPVREINCAVMGNEELVASACEEPMSWESFLSYDDKYLHGQAGKGMKGSRRRVPADIPDELTREIQDLAIKAFRAVDCRGIARVDLLVDRETQAVYLNEVNTLPGSMSFYLWQPLGLTPSQVVDNLIQLAIEAAEDKARTTFSFDSNLLEKADLSQAQK